MDNNNQTKKQIFKTTIHTRTKNNKHYYQCTKCNYSTNHTSHFKRHIISCQPHKYSLFFLQHDLNIQNSLSFSIKDLNNNKTKEPNNPIKNNLTKSCSSIAKNTIYESLYNLKQIFDNNNHLSYCDFALSSNFIIHSNKIIGEGSFSTCYLGQDNLSGIKVAILKIDLDNDDKYLIEEYIRCMD